MQEAYDKHDTVCVDIDVWRMCEDPHVPGNYEPGDDAEGYAEFQPDAILWEAPRRSGEVQRVHWCPWQPNAPRPSCPPTARSLQLQWGPIHRLVQPKSWDGERHVHLFLCHQRWLPAPSTLLQLLKGHVQHDQLWGSFQSSWGCSGAAGATGCNIGALAIQSAPAATPPATQNPCRTTSWGPMKHHPRNWKIRL